MRKGWFSVLSIMFLGLLVLSTCFASWIVPYNPNEEVRGSSYHPPSRIHFLNEPGKFDFRPFIYETKSYFDENMKRTYSEIKTKKYFIKLGSKKLLAVEKPARLYILGADSRGRDLFSRIIYGARTSLAIAIIGVFIATTLGFLIGAISGYFGGWLDHILMRIAEFFIMIPGFYFLLALRGALPPTLGSLEIYLLIIIILSFIGWGGIARVIRGMVLSLREREFIYASRMLGISDFKILFKHILPHTFSYLTVIISVSLPGYILGESALSVLGLGIQEPNISLGNLLIEALSIAHLKFHPWVLYPGFFIFLIAFSCNVLGDAFREKQQILDPR